MGSPGLATAAAVMALLFGAMSFWDGIVIHLWRLRLHARPATRLEHLIHTGRALGAPVLLIAIFSDATGWLLWAGIAVLVLDQLLEIADGVVEKRARAGLGGLGVGEYLVHLTAGGLRAGSIALALAARPAAAWRLDAPAVRGLELLDRVGDLLLPGVIATALLHVALAAWPTLDPRSRTAPALGQ